MKALVDFTSGWKLFELCKCVAIVSIGLMGYHKKQESVLLQYCDGNNNIVCKSEREGEWYGMPRGEFFVFFSL